MDLEDLIIKVYKKNGKLYMKWEANIKEEIHGLESRIYTPDYIEDNRINDMMPWEILKKTKLLVDHLERYYRKSQGLKEFG